MKSPIIFTTLLAAVLAAADIDISPVPSPSPPLPACGRVVDLAVLAAQTAVNRALQPFGIAELKDAVDAGTAAFKREIGCGGAAATPEDSARPGQEPPAQRDCSGVVDNALAVAVAALKRGFPVVGVPKGYDKGVEEGVKAFKKTLGCKEAAA
ncbi:hypothetical protein LMH87_007263 [Akanthomyces muscarius]|uniref:Cell wall protein n=1 Tax=Akanthomyces muscarius TaxID=2231603 RepID=A0A9W8UU02_AKAMU|nr:hypothetical protein LMH87_007263 [Akanthomyces muscarius]KAJ4165639.1 hypothetical protein LMH87_007263 [Akanthomyces muscarius]